MKKTWKRALCALMVLVLVLAVCPVMAFAAGELTIMLHYHRPDGNYEGWDVWTWAEGKDGAAIPFEEVDGEMVAAIPVSAGTTKVGFIVRQGGDSWSAKDVDADQFIELGEIVAGTVHIYVESGVEGYTQENGPDVITGVQVTGAKYDIDKVSVRVTTTADVKSEDLTSAFQIQGPDGEVEIQSVVQNGRGSYIVALAAPLDTEQTYQIIYDGTEFKITMPNIYSTTGFEEAYTYEGTDLGAVWTKEKTTFRVWAPTAQAVSVNLYTGGTDGENDLIETLPMTADEAGTWVAEKEGDLNGTYYTYSVTVGGETVEACDPYARTTGVNGQRAMVIDLDSTDPEGWDTDANPHAGEGYTDAVIYELHVRDLSTDENSGITNVGKFLGLTETGTKTPGGVATGLDHIKELGVTHVHLLPSYDYGSVDETKLDQPQFNWGYDPVNYNVPEGSYSTDPYHGEVRVKEMKQMVQSLHENGVSVIMDVVYNHVQSATNFCFNKIVPGYFSRIDDNGNYSSGSGCGNDTASERSMVRKYIVESVKYWADEYHIDGFRFDLVGLLDTETINQIVEEVHKDHPDVIFYGEGWTMTTTVTKQGVAMATQTNSEKTPGFAFFSDTIRDALKGSVFSQEPGFVSGATTQTETIRQCFQAITSWCTNPSQIVNYASCHDNNTLMDRLALSRPDASRADYIRMNNLTAAIYMTAQGIPFLQAGEEMLRTKVNEDGSFNENSYNASDEVNSLKWATLEDPEYASVFEYYKGLIAFRKAHAGLRLTTAEDVKANVTAVEGLPDNVVAFQIQGGAGGEESDGLYLIFNANPEAVDIQLPAGNWDVCVNAEKAGKETLETVSGKVSVEPISALILVKGEGGDPEPTQTTPPTQAPTTPPTTQPQQEQGSGMNGGLIAGILGAVAVIAGVIAGCVYYRKKKK